MPTHSKKLFSKASSKRLTKPLSASIVMPDTGLASRAFQWTPAKAGVTFPTVRTAYPADANIVMPASEPASRGFKWTPAQGRGDSCPLDTGLRRYDGFFELCRAGANPPYSYPCSTILISSSVRP